MFTPLVERPEYCRAEYLSDAVIHAVGLVAAAAAVPALIVLTKETHPAGGAVFAVSVYATTLVLMLVCSAIYNVIPRPDWYWLFKRLDHSAIYLKIAGTYTPFAALSGQGAGFVATLWGAAVAGLSLKMLAPDRFRVAGLALYLGMGWAGLILGWPLIVSLPGPVLALMALGGGLYTVGVIFHLWEGLRFHNTIWHVFVLAATLAVFSSVMLHVRLTA